MLILLLIICYLFIDFIECGGSTPGTAVNLVVDADAVAGTASTTGSNWYSFSIRSDTNYTVEVFFSHADGDLSLSINSECQEASCPNSPEYQALSLTDNERVTFYSGTEGTRWIRVYPDSSVTMPVPYTVRVFVPEDDNIPGKATPLTVDGDLVYGTARALDSDWYSFMMLDATNYTVELMFSHSDGDLQLAIYSSCQSSSCTGAPEHAGMSVSDNERISFFATTTGLRWIRVYGDTSVTVPVSYTLRVFVPEDDNIPGKATQLTVNGDAAKGTVRASDTDWYSFAIQDGTNYTVELQFSHTDGDLSFDIYSDCQESTCPNSPQHQALSLTDNERLSFFSLTVGTRWIKVFADSSVTNPVSYTISVSGQKPPTSAPTAAPTIEPSTAPSTAPTTSPSTAPSTAPSTTPSAAPSTAPSTTTSTLAPAQETTPSSTQKNASAGDTDSSEADEKKTSTTKSGGPVVAEQQTGVTNDIGAIAGGVTGALAVIFLLPAGVAVIWIRRRRQTRRTQQPVHHSAQVPLQQLSNSDSGGPDARLSKSGSSRRRSQRKKSQRTPRAQASGGDDDDGDDGGDYGQLELKPAEVATTTPTSADGGGNTSDRERQYVIRPDELVRKKQLGAGNFGEVWHCSWKGVSVAVKVAKGNTSTAARAQLELEASRFKALQSHPNVISFYGLVLDPLSVVLEFAPGGALDDALYGSQPRSFSAQQSIAIVCGAALGVAHLHDNNVIHRDVAARNVLLGHGDVPKITDFGMSRESTASGGQRQHTATVVGPVKWMAPEQMSDQVVSKEADVFSLGVVIYEVFAKQKPWAGVKNVEAARRVMQGETLPVPVDAPPIVADAMRSCCQFEASLRPTARSLAELLTTESPRQHESEYQEPEYVQPPKSQKTKHQ